MKYLSKSFAVIKIMLGVFLEHLHSVLFVVKNLNNVFGDVFPAIYMTENTSLRPNACKYLTKIVILICSNPHFNKIDN